MKAPQDLPVWLWAVFPPLMFVALVLAWFTEPAWVQEMTRRDTAEGGGGVVEHATFLMLLPGIVAGFAVFRGRARLPDARLGWWVLLGTLACIYFAGEETSWGQHYFSWQSPELFKLLNKQQETNLHNMSSWLDRKPRAVVELGVIIGGLLLPLWRWLRGTRLNPRGLAYWILPTAVLVPTALLFMVFRLHKWVRDSTGFEVTDWLSDSETREYYIALFLSLYLLSIWRRLRSSR
jgi:hypothetical protein